MNHSRMGRRAILTRAALAAALPALAVGGNRPQAADSRRLKSLDLADPVLRLATVIRMRGAMDLGLVITFLEGVYYGVMEARIRPLYGISAALFRQYRPRSDGGFDCVNYELVFITDLDTGGLLSEFRNPYSGQVVKPPQARFGPSRLAILPTLEVQRATAHFHRFHPPRVVGDDVWIVEESAMQLPPPANVPLNELLTYHASLRDLLDPSATHVPTTVQFSPVIGWRPWQGMQGFDAPPSHVMGFCAGRVVRTLEELPADLRRWMAEFHPDIAVDPLRLLAPAWAAPVPVTGPFSLVQI